MNLKLKRTPGIYIVGFMGVGKTTIARYLAEEIGWRFADLDEDIEHGQKRTISELFAAEGEEEFRRIEHEAIQRRVQTIRRGMPMVLALGGGSFTREDNIELLNNNGITIWIDAAYWIVKRRTEGATHRPLARDPHRFEKLYQDRRPLYALADYHVELTEDSSRTAVSQILKLPFWADE